MQYISIFFIVYLVHALVVYLSMVSIVVSHLSMGSPLASSALVILLD